MELFRNKNWFLAVIATVLFAVMPAKAQVTIGSTDAPHQFSILELISNESGLRLPQLNETERDALKQELLTLNDVAAKGLVIFNTAINCVEFWSGEDWISLCQPSKPFLSVGPSNLIFDFRGKPAQNVTVITTIPEGWTVESGYPNWIEVSTESSNGIILTINATVNDGAERDGVITIKAGTITETITIKQLDELTMLGEGTVAEPYLILTPPQLDDVRNKPDAHYKVGRNIDISEYVAKWDNKGWLPIGNTDYPFTGSVDGDEYTISGLSIQRPESGIVNMGLFGLVDDGVIKNLKVELSGSINGGTGTYVGGLAGRITGENAIVRNCQVLYGEIHGGNYIGGVVGRVDHGGLITGCYSSVLVIGSNGVGGIVGQVSSDASVDRYGAVTNCYSNSDVRGTTGVGGVVGRLQRAGKVYNCYATGPISRGAPSTNANGNYIGGAVGRVDQDGIVTNCVALNSSVSTTFGFGIGRVTGSVDRGALNSNYAQDMLLTNGDGTPKNPLDATATGLDGATITSANYESESWWLNASNWNTTSPVTAWDFTKIWKWDTANNRPILQWQ